MWIDLLGPPPTGLPNSIASIIRVHRIAAALLHQLDHVGIGALEANLRVGGGAKVELGEADESEMNTIQTAH